MSLYELEKQQAAELTEGLLREGIAARTKRGDHRHWDESRIKAMAWEIVECIDEQMSNEAPIEDLYEEIMIMCVAKLGSEPRSLQ